MKKPVLNDYIFIFLIYLYTQRQCEKIYTFLILNCTLAQCAIVEQRLLCYFLNLARAIFLIFLLRDVRILLFT